MPRATTRRLLAAVGLAPLLALAACGGGSSSSSSSGPATTVASSCPDRTVLTVTADDGTHTLDAVSSYADVTLGQSASFTIANYPIDRAAATGIYNPTLNGDQLGVSFYISANGDAQLTTGEYVESSDGSSSPLVLNTSSAYDSSGRIILGGTDLPSSTVTLTEITDTRLCGTVSTPEFSGRFAAERI